MYLRYLSVSLLFLDLCNSKSLNETESDMKNYADREGVIHFGLRTPRFRTPFEIWVILVLLMMT